MKSAMPCHARKPLNWKMSNNSNSADWVRPCVEPGHKLLFKKQFVLRQLMRMSLNDTAFKNAENRDVKNALPTAETTL